MEGMIAVARSDAAPALRACAEGHGWQDEVCLAIADNAGGRHAEAAADLQKFQRGAGDTAAYQYAEVYAQRSQPPVAAPSLQTAYRLHDSGLADLTSDALLDPTRATPQYRDVERRLNVPP